MRGLAILLLVTAALLLGTVSAHSAMASSSAYVTLSYTVKGGGHPEPPVLQYTLNGRPFSVALTTTPTTYQMDTRSQWSVSQALPGSNETTRWELSGLNMGSPEEQTLTLTYYTQYYVKFDVTASGNLQTIKLPYVTFNSLGFNTSVYASNSAWVDSGSPYSYGSASSTRQGIRWYGTDVNGVVEGSGIISPLFTEQYLLNFSLSSSGPNGLGSVNFTDTYGGNLASWVLRVPGGQFYADYNTTFSFPAAVYPASGGNRWSLRTITSEIADAPANVTVNYVEQYPLTVSFSVSSGTPPSGPVITLIFNGQQNSFQTYAGAAPTWGDFGSPYSVSDLLTGSSSSERWVTTANATGVLSGPTNLSLQYYHQVLISFSYSVVGGGSIGPSSAFYYDLGSQAQAPLNTAQTSVWADAGTVMVVQGTFAGASPLERWELGSSSSILLSSPVNLPFVYYHQYSLQVYFSIQGGGSPTPPVFAGVQTGMPFSSSVLSGNSLWLDAGTPWSLSESLQSPTPGERWFAGGGENGTAGQQASIAVTYIHQYLVTVEPNSQSGGTVSQGGWDLAGQPVKISASAAPGWALVAWQGSGEGAYSGTNATFTVRVQGPLQESANFGLGLAVQAYGGGTVQVSVGTSSYTIGGTPVTLYVAPGSKVVLTAKAGPFDSFTGWRGVPAGSAGTVVFTPTSPLGVAAVFATNKVLAYGLAVLYFGFAVFATFYLLRNLRESKRNMGARAR